MKRIIDIADAAGAKTLAVPVLAGGTAAKRLKDEGLNSEQDIIEFLFFSLAETLAHRQTSIEQVYLVVYGKDNLTPELVKGIDARFRSKEFAGH